MIWSSNWELLYPKKTTVAMCACVYCPIPSRLGHISPCERREELWCCKHIPCILSPPLCSCWAYCEVLIRGIWRRARLTFAVQKELQPRMTVAPLGAETSTDLNCTLKGQHMTGNQSAPNWMIRSHLNIFQIFFFFLLHLENLMYECCLGEHLFW